MFNHLFSPFVHNPNKQRIFVLLQLDFPESSQTLIHQNTCQNYFLRNYLNFRYIFEKRGEAAHQHKDIYVGKLMARYNYVAYVAFLGRIDGHEVLNSYIETCILFFGINI